MISLRPEHQTRSEENGQLKGCEPNVMTCEYYKDSQKKSIKTCEYHTEIQGVWWVGWGGRQRKRKNKENEKFKNKKLQELQSWEYHQCLKF